MILASGIGPLRRSDRLVALTPSGRQQQHLGDSILAAM